MLEPVDHQYKLVGTITSSHGVDGTVIITPETDTPTLFDDIVLVRLKDARGDLIPARIASVRVQQQNRLSFFVKFEHIKDRNGSESHRNYGVYLPKDNTDHEESDETSETLVSFEVRDVHDVPIGIVDTVMDNLAHPILAVQTDQTSLLIPLVDEYVRGIDENEGIIRCKNLKQLMDLS